jgi:ATPase family associated with various cellular activities (AAA)
MTTTVEVAAPKDCEGLVTTGNGSTLASGPAHQRVARTADAAGPMSLAGVTELGERLRASVRAAVEVPEQALEVILATLLAGGHLLIEDHPGVGKTMLARALAASVGGRMTRIQATIDLLPGDIVGANVWRPEEGRFHFQPGPVFANVVLVDEINRATPKTQSGLLESMEERQVTVDGDTAAHLPTVHGHRHAEPDGGSRRHLRTAAGVARPFPGPRVAGLPVTPGGDAAAPG